MTILITLMLYIIYNARISLPLNPLPAPLKQLQEVS
jgi:hypothetical protein